MATSMVYRPPPLHLTACAWPHTSMATSVVYLIASRIPPGPGHGRPRAQGLKGSMAQGLQGSGAQGLEGQGTRNDAQGAPDPGQDRPKVALGGQKRGPRKPRSSPRSTKRRPWGPTGAHCWPGAPRSRCARSLPTNPLGGSLYPRVGLGSSGPPGAAFGRSSGRSEAPLGLVSGPTWPLNP